MRLVAWKRNAPDSANSSSGVARLKMKSPRSSWMKKPTRSSWICCDFQVQEISTARLQPDEEKSVEEEFIRSSNAAKLLQLSQAALDALSENENSLLTQSGVIGRVLAELQRVDAGAAEISSSCTRRPPRHCTNCRRNCRVYADKVDVDPARLAEVEERLNLIHSLKRKYGSSLAEVIAFGDEAQQELQALESRDVELARINAALAKLDAEILNAGKKLSAARRKVIPSTCQIGRQTIG